MADKRRIVANPTDPVGGEYSFAFYGQTTKNGDPDAVTRARTALRGLSGKDVRVTVVGQRFEADDPDNVHSTRLSERITLNRYGDIFGKDGVLLEILKRQVEKNSDDVYTVQYIDIEEI